MNKLEIEIPKGFEIDKKESSLTKVVIKKNHFNYPRQFKELKEINGCYIDDYSNLSEREKDCFEAKGSNRNVYPTEELAEAGLALIQLLQLRERYRGGWTPDILNHYNYSIIFLENAPIRTKSFDENEIFSFKEEKTRDLFLENFKDTLLKEVKPLFCD